MMEIKIIISYIAICLTYSLCRLHYLLTIKEDDGFNNMLDSLIELSGDRNTVIKELIFLQIILSPITAPFSFLKQIFKIIFQKILKK